MSLLHIITIVKIDNLYVDIALGDNLVNCVALTHSSQCHQIIRSLLLTTINSKMLLKQLH